MAKKEKSEEKKIDLKTLLAQVNKKYGEGTIGIAAASKGLVIPRIPFNVFALDYATGGGVPYGRITGFHGAKSCGKTSGALRVVASSQQFCREHLIQMIPLEDKVYVCPECGSTGDCEGEVCSFCESNGIDSAFIDIGRYKVVCPECKQYNPLRSAWYDLEGAFCNPWAARFGVDCSQLLITRPESAESAIDMADGIMKTGEIDLHIIDSIAALVPSAEIEGSMEDNNVGLQARLVNKMLRKFSANMNKPGAGTNKRPTVIMINQIRHKINCFEYNTKVTLSDGRTEKIGKLVCSKYSGSVLCVNEATGLVESKPVIGWHKNGSGSDYLLFFVKGGNSGYYKFKCTPDHKIYTPNGIKAAKDLKCGDTVSTMESSCFTDDQHNILLGSMFGDGSLRFGTGGQRGYMRLLHGSKQADYCRWKAESLGVKSRTERNGRESAESAPTEEFRKYADITKKKGVVQIPQHHIDALNAKSIAIWYMDDGTYSGSHKRWGFGKCSISAKILCADSMQALSDKFSSLGIPCTQSKLGKGFMWCGKNAEMFQKFIAQFVIPSMRYKIKQGMPDFNWCVVKKQKEAIVGYSTIHSINTCTKKLRRYDITVEGNHNYFVGGGVLVHNCMYGSPDTLPGGLGQEFATSIDIKFNPQKLVDDKQGNPQYQESGFRCVKNKCSIPHRSARYRMWLDYDSDGHYPTDTEEIGVVLGLADKSGCFGNGKEGWKLWEKSFKTRKDLVEFVMSDVMVFRKLREELLTYRFGDLDTTKNIMTVQSGEDKEDD